MRGSNMVNKVIKQSLKPDITHDFKVRFGYILYLP